MYLVMVMAWVLEAGAERHRGGRSGVLRLRLYFVQEESFFLFSFYNSIFFLPGSSITIFSSAYFLKRLN